MRSILLGCLTIIALLSAAVTPHHGQTSRRRAPQRRGTRATNSPATASTAEATELRRRLAEQVKLLSQFVYLYGRISGTIEATERAGGESSEASRGALVDNVRNVRSGLDDLAERFSRVPALTNHGQRVASASDLAGRAESSIRSGRLDDAGKDLVTAVNALTDVLTDMR